MASSRRDSSSTRRPLYAERVGDFDRVDASEDDACVLARLAHRLRAAFEGVRHDAVGAVVRDYVQHRHAVMRGGPQAGVGVVERAVAHEAHDGLVGRRASFTPMVAPTP